MAERPQVGFGIPLSKTPSDFVLGAPANARRWRHPWTVSVKWEPESERWAATIQAGFVNGIAPIFRTTIREQYQVGQEFGTNPLTGKPWFSADIFKKDKPGYYSRSLDLSLDLRPAIPLERWRAIGSDGFGSEPLPSFFAGRGVEAFDASVSTPESRLRRLRAIDLILHQPRLALTSRVEVENGILTGGSFSRQVLEIRTPAADDVLRVYAGHFLDKLPEIDPLADIYEEPAWDELKIATVYLLSPVATKSGAEPGADWKPFVKHELFWNLHWIPARRFVEPGGGIEPFPLPVYSGIAQPVINTLTAAGNDLVQQALNRIVENSQAGTFWTPTGGGHAAELPTIIPKLKISGMDKSGRALQRRLTAAASLLQQAREGLDPAFPFKALPLDLDRLQ